MHQHQYDLICFSHLRWDFVYQRPQHLMARAARERRVIFFEEPVQEGSAAPQITLRQTIEAVTIATPVFPAAASPDQVRAELPDLVSRLLRHLALDPYVAWLYTPMALPLIQGLSPRLVVYDCMDELSLFKNAPAEMTEREKALLGRADVVFTGGQSLYLTKRHLHHNIHPFPSAVDFDHFAKARGRRADPPDQAGIPAPRAGFFGVVDERLDIELVSGLAELRPDLHLVMVGPVVKIDPAILPRRPNIHWLGQKRYAELPAYLSGWDVALLPFARNDATRFISPTKTPEYLAAGKPVVATTIRDVVEPYGSQGLVRIADTPEQFAQAIDAVLTENPAERVAAADRLVRRMSWDRTWIAMDALVRSSLLARAGARRGASRGSRATARSRRTPGAIGAGTT